MTGPRRRTLLLALIAAQAVILVTLPLLHGARIAAGTEVRLRVQPVDPTDLARGSYVDLDYAGFGRLEVPDEAEPGDELYVELRSSGEGGIDEPSGTVVLDREELDDGARWIRVHAGCCDGDDIPLDEIGTFYASPDQAKAAEEDLAAGNAVAVVSLDEDGDPTLVDLVEG